jgi:hypothetical protein
MARKLTKRDPIASAARKAVAQRRVGHDAVCVCGEKRPETLIRKSDSVMCAACTRKMKGRTTNDQHHIAGKNNHPATISIPVNDHRAQLSIDQMEWPKKTLENPDKSPLLAAAACIRGFVDMIIYLIQQMLDWISEMLEALDARLTAEWGDKWWLEINLFLRCPPATKNA